MSIGSGELNIYNNYVAQVNGFKAGSGNGLTIISAKGGAHFYNNIILNAGGYGMFIHNRLRLLDPENVGYYIYNNTIVESIKSGIFYN